MMMIDDEDRHGVIMKMIESIMVREIDMILCFNKIYQVVIDKVWTGGVCYTQQFVL